MTLSLHKISLETFFSSFFCVFFAGEESKLPPSSPLKESFDVFPESTQSTHKHREYTEYIVSGENLSMMPLMVYIRVHQFFFFANFKRMNTGYAFLGF